MTIIERVNQAIEQGEYDTDNINKLIAMAYYIGAERATKKICDEHNKRVSQARDAAAGVRYYRQAHAVLDAMGGDVIYDANYAQDLLSTFGSDEVSI